MAVAAGDRSEIARFAHALRGNGLDWHQQFGHHVQNAAGASQIRRNRRFRFGGKGDWAGYANVNARLQAMLKTVRRRSEPRYLSWRQHQSIADGSFRLQIFRLGRVVLQFLPEMSHIDAQIVPAFRVRRPPHLTQQLRVCDHPSGVV